MNVECEGELYIVGGERNGVVFDVFEKFNWKINIWMRMFLMLKLVLFFVVVFFGNCLYVVGVFWVNRGLL